MYYIVYYTYTHTKQLEEPALPHTTDLEIEIRRDQKTCTNQIAKNLKFKPSFI